MIRYKAHPAYWRGKAKIDNLIFAITKDPSVRWAKLKVGECHIIPYPAPADLAAIRKDAKIKMLEQEGLNVGYLAFNTEKKPFDNMMVRQALSMAIDKSAIIRAVFQGAGKSAINPIPPTMWSYNKNVKDYAYDPVKAKALLAKAGFPNGFSTDIWAMPVQRPYNPNARRMAEIIQANWAKIGVKAKIVSYEWGEYLKRSKNGEHQTILHLDLGIRKDAKIKMLEQEGLNVGYLAFNTEKKPFDNMMVRQALSMAIDKSAIIRAVFQGAGKSAINPIPPTMWSYNKNVKDYAYDPVKAKALLAKAGFPNGFSTDIWAMPVQRPYNPNARRMAEIIQANWAKIGVKAKIVSYEWGEYLKRSKNGEHQTILLGWTGDNGDPDNFLHVLLGCAAAKSGPNRARWCYKPFDNLLMQAKTTTNVAKRTALYMKAQSIFKQQAPWVTIAHSVVFMPMRKNVVGYIVHPLGSHHFYSVDLK